MLLEIKNWNLSWNFTESDLLDSRQKFNYPLLAIKLPPTHETKKEMGL
jgi:hypothetical protein